MKKAPKTKTQKVALIWLGLFYSGWVGFDLNENRTITLGTIQNGTQFMRILED